MRPNYAFTILHISILVLLLFTLDAESEDDDCVPEMKVRRHTVHNVSLGENLRIECPVTFCKNSQPPIYWYKYEKTFVPVNLNRSTHIKTEWKISTSVEGISFLIFQNIQKSDSGQYRCQSEGSVSHAINVYVCAILETVNITGSTTTQEALWPFVYCVAGVVVFVNKVMTIYAVTKYERKGVRCARKSKNTQDLSPQPLPGGSPAHQHALPTFHICEDDPNDSDYINVPS